MLEKGNLFVVLGGMVRTGGDGDGRRKVVEGVEGAGGDPLSNLPHIRPPHH